jgi:hypothetical protein
MKKRKIQARSSEVSNHQDQHGDINEHRQSVPDHLADPLEFIVGLVKILHWAHPFHYDFGNMDRD